MARTYLLPEDVATADAALVLAFLNTARDADEIDQAIELPDEPDIGPLLALRLINRRDELGGYTSLDQVYAVPYIGPHRFTQLVTSLSSARPPQGGPDEAMLAQFSRRLDELEDRIQGQAGIRLQAINPDALIGQETTLLAEIFSADGQPLIDQDVTFVTTWGRLRGRHGIQPVSGNSITVRSDHLGLCKVRLSASLGETLDDVEAASLTRALTIMGTAEGSPRQNLDTLTELVREYRAPGNESLRNAIDALSKHYADNALQDAPANSLSTWPRINVTVIALLPSQDDNSGTQPPSNIINVRQRNWFHAWLWAYRQLLENDSQLGASLIAVNADDRSGRGVLSDIYSRIGSFVGIQEGLIGKQLGEQFAADRLKGFLETGLNGVNAEERTRVLAGVSSGVGSLQGTKSFGALNSSRTELQLDVDAGISKVDTGVQFDALEARVSMVEQNAITQDDLGSLRTDILRDANAATTAQIDALQENLDIRFDAKADMTALNDLRTDIDRDLATKADVTLVDGLRDDLINGLEGKADLSALNELQTNIDRDLATKADVTLVDGLRDDLINGLEGKADVSALNELRTGIDRDLATKADVTMVDGLRSDLRNGLEVKADVSTVNGLRADVDRDLATKADVSTVNGLRNDLRTGLDSKADNTAVTNLENDMNQRLDAKADATVVTGLTRDVTQLNDRTRAINTNLNRLDTNVNNRFNALNRPPRR